MRSLTLFKVIAGLAALLFAGALIQRSQPRPARATQTQELASPTAAAVAATAVAAVRHPRHRSAFATTSALVLGLILILGTLGVVNGLWSKNLTVSGQVETGDLKASWDKLRTHDVCGETNTVLPPKTATPGPHGYGVAGGNDHDDHDEDDPCEPSHCSDDHRSAGNCAPECDAAIGGVGPDAAFGNQVAYVDIEDAAPEYWCEIKGWVSNRGSIPFNIIGVNGILDAKNDDGLSFYDLNPGKAGDCKLVDKDGKTITNSQVDPGKDGIVVCKVVIDKEIKTCKSWHHGDCKEWTYEDGAKAGWTYHFAIEVCVAQWNEDPSTGGQPEDFAACKHPNPGTHEGPDSSPLPTPGSGH